jgi:hypothetical protein
VDGLRRWLWDVRDPEGQWEALECDSVTAPKGRSARVKRLAFVVAIASLLVSAASFASDPLTGKVVGITDGDTITVLVDRKQGPHPR